MSGACVPYLLELEGRDYLCVISGGQFHRFEISEAAVARLGAEAGLRMWREHGQGGGVPGWAAKIGIAVKGGQPGKVTE